jgi:hypothetical protein
MAKITFKQIDGEIAKFTTDADELNARAHRINVMILKHLAPTFCGDDFQGSGDMSRVPNMVMAMPASWRRTEEIRWWEVHTPCRIKYSQGKVVAFGFDKRYIALAKKHKDDPEALEAARKEWWDVETALNLPFYMMAEDNAEEPATSMDLEALLKLVHQLGKRIAKKTEEGAVDPELEATALAMAERLQKFKQPVVKAKEPETEDA